MVELKIKIDFYLAVYSYVSGFVTSPLSMEKPGKKTHSLRNRD